MAGMAETTGNKEKERVTVKVLISADAEGITGIFKKSQVTPGRPDYGHFRKLVMNKYTREAPA